METQKEVLGEEHPSTPISMGNLASTYRYLEQWRETEELFIQVTKNNARAGARRPKSWRLK